ncbi:NAD(P)H-binding protein [Nocardioides insulae]|uniref:NAD(P)H-binding protein n=1 Tax=Nocardioides insulae TaxID=394734 RepID=UPI00041236F5|nr:NAD(P)H-binding protein [Nocardioides insulae]
MPQLPRIALTGATGGLGGRVARRLAASGVPARLLSRSPERLPALPGAVATSLGSGYADAPAVRAALSGVSTLLLVSAAESSDRLDQHRAIVDAAVAEGVGHVVYTSFYGASPEATFTFARTHAATEEYLRASGMAVTFLRDNFYLDILPDLVGGDGAIRGPAGEGRLAAVSRDDVAAAAAAVLADPEPHRGATYDLTGPEALTFAEVAEILTEFTGRVVRFHDETVEEAYESRRRWDAPQWQYDAWVTTYTAIAAGELAGVTDHVERLTGHRPIGLRGYLATH